MAKPGTSGPQAGRRTPERARPDQDQRRTATDIDFWAVFESAPDAYLLLAPDPPRFTILAANESRLRLTMTGRAEIIGRPLFEVFPDNPTDPNATGGKKLQESLDEVLRSGKPHRMGLQRYDIRTPNGEFEERYWDPLNTPIFEESGNLIYIVHRVEDVTGEVRAATSPEVLSVYLRDTTDRSRAEQALRASEERYRLLADLIPQHVWTTDPNGYHGYFSRRWYDYTGATLEETKGDRWLRFVHPDDLERTAARWEQSLETGEPYSIEYRFRRADGEYRWFLGQALPQRDDWGAIVGWFGTLTDISGQKLLEQERERLFAREREAREQVTTILESITDAFFAVDREWRFTYLNSEAERLLQRTREELLGQSMWDEFSDAAGSSFEREYTRAMAEQTTVQFEEFFPPLRAWFDVRAFPTAGGISVFFRDVTARKLAREKLRESEARFRSLAENAVVGIFVIDDESTIEFANPAVERIFGYPVEEMVGQSLNKLMPQDQRTPHEAGVRRYLETGRRNIRWEGVELPGLRKDGRIVPLEISMGEFVREGRHYFTGIARDITERKQAEEAMRESEERFRALANSIPQLAWMADPTGWIFWYNERWHEYTGATLEEMQGWGWQKVLHAEHEQRVVEGIRHAFGAGEPWEDTFPLRSRTGEYRWFLSRALPIRDANGTVVRWFGTNTDITDQIDAVAERERLLDREREARAEADRRRGELERVTESRTRLMRGFTHDVKNPLRAADGYAQLLEDGILGELSAKQRESVQRIRRTIQISLHLIHELLELARAEAGQIELHPVPIDVAELVREAAEDFRAQANGAGLELEVRTPESLPTQADPKRVRQILSNVLSNAVKYTPEGTITTEAELCTDGRAPSGGDWIAIHVTDTGPGIPEEKQETIFHEFTRLDPEAQHGAGVGLAISRRIARLLGGDMTVQSEVGRGSTFTFWLPLGKGE